MFIVFPRAKAKPSARHRAAGMLARRRVACQCVATSLSRHVCFQGCGSFAICAAVFPLGRYPVCSCNQWLRAERADSSEALMREILACMYIYIYICVHIHIYYTHTHNYTRTISMCIYK